MLVKSGLVLRVILLQGQRLTSVSPGRECDEHETPQSNLRRMTESFSVRQHSHCPKDDVSKRFAEEGQGRGSKASVERGLAGATGPGDPRLSRSAETGKGYRWPRGDPVGAGAIIPPCNRSWPAWRDGHRLETHGCEESA